MKCCLGIPLYRTNRKQYISDLNTEAAKIYKIWRLYLFSKKIVSVHFDFVMFWPT